MFWRDPGVLHGGSLGQDAVQRQLHAVRGEDRPVLGDVQLVRLARVVEARLDLDREPHHAADHADVADQPVPVGCRAAGDRHEVVYLADAVRGHEPGDQDRGVRQVELLGHVVVAVRRDPVEATPFGIQQRCEYAR